MTSALISSSSPSWVPLHSAVTSRAWLTSSARRRARIRCTAVRHAQLQSLALKRLLVSHNDEPTALFRKPLCLSSMVPDVETCLVLPEAFGVLGLRRLDEDAGPAPVHDGCKFSWNLEALPFTSVQKSSGSTSPRCILKPSSRLKPSRQGGELVPDVFDNRLIPILTRLDTLVGELLSDVSLAYVLAPPEVDDGYLTAVCGSQALSASASLHVDVPADFPAAGKVVAPTALVEGPHAKIKALFEEFDLGSEVAALSLVGAASLSELLACEQQLRLRLQRLPDKAGRIQFIQWYLKVCFEDDGG